MTRREAVLSALGIFVVAVVVRAVMAAGTPVPGPGRGVLRGRRAEPGRGARPRHRCDLELHHAAAGVPAARVRGLAAAARPAVRAAAGARWRRVRGSGRISRRPRARPRWSRCSWARCCRSSRGALRPTWREERALPPDRARTLALGTGFAAAVYLPLVLHGVQPDSTTLFGVFAVSVCLLATRVLRDPRGARLLDPRLLAMGLLLGLAALTRNEAAYLALVWAWLAWRRAGLGARRACSADRRGGGGLAAGVRAVDAPQRGGVRQPAARPGRSSTRSPCSPRTSSPGTIRPPWRGTWTNRPRAWSPCASRVLRTTW